MFGGIFLFFQGCRILDGYVEVFEKKSFSTHGKGGIIAHYRPIIVQYPPSSPPLLPTILRNKFSLRPPCYCNKILAISCKGQTVPSLFPAREARAAGTQPDAVL